MVDVVIPVPRLVSIDWLKADGSNPNRMNPEQREALKKNFAKYGFIVPIICNEEGLIADGQHRWEIAKELGMKEVLVIVLPLKEVDRRMLRQILNKLRGEHDFFKDVSEYEQILVQEEGKEFSELIALDRVYFEEAIRVKNDLPEQYLELVEIAKEDADKLGGGGG